MPNVRAIVVDPGAPGGFAITSVDKPLPGAHEALVRVAATTINGGEVLYMGDQSPGSRPGWDIAGVVEQEATDGSGPRAGSRVVGWLPGGAWAEVIAVPTRNMTVLPESITFAQAATLPAAGLTAWYAMEQMGPILERSILIRGASGGVGLFAVQLAAYGGARVTGLVRQEKHLPSVTKSGAHLVFADATGEAARAHGPFDLILDLAGGEGFGRAITMLSPLGHAICGGVLTGRTTELDLELLLRRGWRVSGLVVVSDIERESAAVGLKRLINLVERGKLKPLISMEVSWTEIGRVANLLRERAFPGKAVLRIG